MSSQDFYWSQAACSYEKDFIDPYSPDVRNPLLKALAQVASPVKVAADFGCGIGPLLPLLADYFQHVHAIDFADGMLQRARERMAGRSQVTFLRGSFTAL